jgi:iron complex outermembrane receptor protein
MFRADANWQSDVNLSQNPDLPIYSSWGAGIAEVPAYWLLNSRLALRDFNLGGIKTELALWGMNLTNERAASYALNLSNIIAAANYIPARTYGLDLSIEF